MYKITSTLDAGLYINGKEFTGTPLSFVQSVHIAAHAHYQVPLITLSITDMADMLPYIGLQDGVTLQFSLKGVKNIDRRYRVYSWDRVPISGGFAYTIYGYHDSPRFFIGTASQQLRGSSSDVLKWLAADCAIEWHPHNAVTSDSMLWTSPNSTVAQFAQQIARYGYVDGKSYMGLAVDSRGVMRYRNIAALPAPTIKVAYTVPTPNNDTVQITDFKSNNVAGNNNVLVGYQHERVVQSSNTKQQVVAISGSTVETGVNAPLLNGNVRALAQRGGISYSPIDFGNVHPNYEQARYQNVRLARLNNLSCEFLFGFQTDFEAFDNFTFVSPSTWPDNSYDGNYIVTGKVIFIAGSQYVEKVIGVRMGLS